MVDITYKNPKGIEEIRKKKKRVQRAARFVSIVFALTAVGALAFVVPNIADKVENHALNDEIRSEVVYENVYTAPTQVQSENGEMTEVTQSYDDIDFETLKQINPETVGWITCEGTNINYPVVQASDNDYYLDHNINKQNSANGWIFLDYRNNSMNLDKNNIIYGHNMYYSGVMFGTLYKTANSSWYTNPDNQIITYNTLYENMNFKIFSIYRIPKTNDYLKVFFENDNDFLSFIDMITTRSIYNFNVPVNADDKIITLSTCSNNGTNRLVIHAVLIDE